MFDTISYATFVGDTHLSEAQLQTIYQHAADQKALISQRAAGGVEYRQYQRPCLR